MACNKELGLNVFVDKVNPFLKKRLFNIKRSADFESKGIMYYYKAVLNTLCLVFIGKSDKDNCCFASLCKFRSLSDEGIVFLLAWFALCYVGPARLGVHRRSQCILLVLQRSVLDCVKLYKMGLLIIQSGSRFQSNEGLFVVSLG